MLLHAAQWKEHETNENPSRESMLEIKNLPTEPLDNIIYNCFDENQAVGR